MRSFATMFSSKVYWSLMLLAIFLLSVIPSSMAMSYSAGQLELTGMICHKKPVVPMAPSCSKADAMAMDMCFSCCRMMPASTPSSAVISVPVSIKKVEVSGIISSDTLFGQNSEKPDLLYASNSPPDLYQDIPVFLRLCTFLN